MPDRNFDALYETRLRKSLDHAPGNDWLPEKLGPPPGIPGELKETGLQTNSIAE